MSFTDEQIEAARMVYVRNLPKRGVPSPLTKPQTRTAIEALSAGFDAWVDSLVASGRTQLEAADAGISAAVSDAELREIMRAVFAVWGG